MKKAKRFNLLEGLSAEPNSVEVSHLQYKNDTIFFPSSNEGKFVDLVKEIELLYYAFGLQLYLSKSYILGINYVEDKMVSLAIANSLGRKVGTCLLKYLNMPLRGNLRVAHF